MRRPPFEFALAFALALVAAVVASGCATVEYVVQAGCGQLDIGLRSEPLSRVAHDSGASPELRALLAEVPAIKRFAEASGLTPTRNYKAYSDVRRGAVVWVVSASEPDAFRARTWTFPIVGSVPYLGWFDRDDARIFADELRSQGLDVDLRGAEAYSTLGWFQDPILSTMVGSGDAALGALANVVLHESVHATYYVKGQSVLNESVAEFLADILTRAYLLEKRGPESAAFEAYDAAERERARRGEALREARVTLQHLYASGVTREEKLATKRRILEALRADIGFRRPINNATLLGFTTYNSGRAELEALYEACGSSPPRLMASLRTLTHESFKKPHDEDIGRVLGQLAAARCPVPAR